MTLDHGVGCIEELYLTLYSITGIHNTYFSEHGISFVSLYTIILNLLSMKVTKTKFLQSPYNYNSQNLSHGRAGLGYGSTWFSSFPSKSRDPLKNRST